MKIQRFAIDSLTPDSNNARKHNEANLASIRNSISEFGQIDPIIVDADNVIRSGNARWQVMKDMGMTHVNVIKTNLKGNAAIAYAIAANRTGELAEWNDIELANQLKALQISDSELLAACGFDEKELERRLLAMQADLATNNEQQEWLDMPEMEADKDRHRTLIVHFECEADVNAFVERLDVTITPTTKYFWWKA